MEVYIDKRFFSPKVPSSRATRSCSALHIMITNSHRYADSVLNSSYAFILYRFALNIPARVFIRAACFEIFIASGAILNSQLRCGHRGSLTSCDWQCIESFSSDMCILAHRMKISLEDPSPNSMTLSDLKSRAI